MKNLGITIAGIFALIATGSSAFAQRGGVHGPQEGGALNPASGATSFTEEKFKQVTNECYFKMHEDSFAPFIGKLRPRETGEGAYGYDLRYQFDKTADGPFAQELIRSGTVSLLISVEAGSVSIHTVDANSQYRDVADLNPEIMPWVGYRTVQVEQFDPYTHTSTGYVTYVTDLTKEWLNSIGYLAQIGAADPSAIVLFNKDEKHTPTNFRLNGTKFFQCVESSL